MEFRELSRAEFPLAEKLWEEYRQQKADHEADRIFGAFVDGTLAGVARCKRHSDGLEVDGVFVPETYRGRGLAYGLMEQLVAACGKEILYMHSTLELVPFYSKFGFRAIPERQLPPTIKERLLACFGEMAGCGVSPMKRMPG
jgi:N-acetylglutamate synthase-like GNAT family acetyltransferase